MKAKKIVSEKTGKALPFVGIGLTLLGSWIKSINDKKALEKTIEKVVDAKLADK